MKAWTLHGIDDLRLETVDDPVLSESEVLVEVKAAGICGSDIPRVYQNGTYSFPLIPGHEFSGVVVKTGLEADNGWLGHRVGIFPLIPCKSCMPCRKNQYEMCRNYSYLGSRRNGGFAEYAAVPAGKVMLVGNPFSDMNLERSVYWKILRNQLTVTGTWNSSFSYPQDDSDKQYPQDDWRYVLEKLADKRVSPTDLITHRFRLEQLEQGFHIMRDKTEDYIKIMGMM